MTILKGNNMMTLAESDVYEIDYKNACKVSIINNSDSVTYVSDTATGLGRDSSRLAIESGTAANEIKLTSGKLYVQTGGNVSIVRC